MGKARSMSNKSNDAGFSLVEALVALAVFAMAGVALVQLQTHSLGAFSRVETRTLADLVAQNELTRIVAARDKPDVSQRDESTTFAGRAWAVSVAVAATPDPLIRRASVLVRAEDAREPAAIAHAFFSVPAPQAAETAP